MGLDIRLPIGVLFSVLGALLTAFGLLSNPAIYERSLGININLGWGLIMIAFGFTMALFGARASRRPSSGRS